MTGTDGGGWAGTDYRGWWDHEDVARRVADVAAGGGDAADAATWRDGAGAHAAMGATWYRSSYSGGGGDDCLEVTDAYVGVVPVRDSKNPDGPKLAFGTAAWAAFVEGVASMT
ncbi:DUF397 domain-containing protein [Streptomyces sp. NPDC001537]